MTAWHDQGVLLFWQTDEAFSIRISRVVCNSILTFCTILILYHSVDWLDLKRKPIYKNDLPFYVSPVNSTIAIFGKCRVAHHSVLLLSIRVVHRYNEWMVIFYSLGQLERCQIIQVKLYLAKLYFLIHSCCHAYLLDVVVSIGGVEHLRSIIWILLLSDACVYSDMSIAKCVYFERQLQ